MIHSRIETLLKRAMGLDAASIGSPAVAQAVKSRLSACELSDTEAYWELVTTAATELQALIEAVIVPETWFFRDREAFTALGRFANDEWLPANPEGTLRLLSLPCSSGEEPYTMAMTLLDAGFPAKRYRVDAIDISTRSLTHAQRAVYGKNSFRGAEQGFRDRYFETTTLGWHLRDEVRQQVQFRYGNLFAEDFLPGLEIYDGIFCRNLLIYFDRDTQDRAIQVLQRLLKPTGMLFVGPSETGLLLRHDFASTRVPLAFALRRSRPAPRVTKSALPAVKSAPAIAIRPVRAPRPSEAATPSADESALDEAFSLADQGRLNEAAKSCAEYLRKHDSSARAYYLMGLIDAAAGNLADASEHYRKALYLDKHHHDSLAHLSLLLDKQGDASGARVLRERLLRLQQKNRMT